VSYFLSLPTRLAIITASSSFKLSCVYLSKNILQILSIVEKKNTGAISGLWRVDFRPILVKK
jgi:hypothetical protein